MSILTTEDHYVSHLIAIAVIYYTETVKLVILLLWVQCRNSRHSERSTAHSSDTVTSASLHFATEFWSKGSAPWSPTKGMR
jgi:hypothetical protein